MNYNGFVKKQLFSCNFEAVRQQSGEFFFFFMILSKFTYRCKYFMLPSVFVKATSNVLHLLIFHLQALNFKDLPQVESLVCLHMEKLAVCWHQCQSVHRND